MKADSARKERIDARARKIAMAKLTDAERARAGLAPLRGRDSFCYCMLFSALTTLLCGIFAGVFSSAVVLCVTVFF